MHQAMRSMFLAGLMLALMAIASLAAAEDVAQYNASERTLDMGVDIVDVAIWNGTIVYQDGAGNIATKDLADSKSHVLDQQAKLPRVGGRYCAWTKNMSNTLIVYDLVSAMYRNTGVNNVTGISMSGGRIALSRFEHDPYTNGSISNIYVYDIANSTLASISLFPSNKMNPCIFGDRVVWQDARYGNKDIYLYDLNTKIERSLVNGLGDQVFPRIWGEWVVYKDQSTSPSRTMAYSILKRSTIMVSTEGGGFPIIYKDKIIYTISGTYLFDIAQNRSYKMSINNVARDIWENRVVDISSGDLVIMEFKPIDDKGVKFMDVLPYIIVAVLVIGGAGTCAAMLWMDEGGSKKKNDEG